MTTTILGRATTFKRRHYGGGQFYCWVHVELTPGNWVSLGDPWPCANPKRGELEAAITRLLQPKPATISD